MFKQIFFSILICLSAVCAFGQTEIYNAPVKWERYKVGEREVSVLFPKLPIVIQGSDVCIEEGYSRYAAYAEDIVYGLNITYKTGQKNHSIICDNKKKFNEKNFEKRLKEIKLQLKTSEETKFNQNGIETIKVKGNQFTFWLINDFNNNRWFELWASEEKENVPSIKAFVESFKIEKNLPGIEIGKGSYRTLGDKMTPAQNISGLKELNTTNAESGELTPLRIILKKRAGYTEAARQNKTQGTVQVRVTFSVSGGIETVSLIKALPYGLSEQAIAAAYKIVFIPAKKNGVNISVTKIVEYSFVIY